MKDSYGRDIRYLRLSVTELCDLRCRYCMPENGVAKKSHDEMLTQEETIDAVYAAASLGIRKVRVTGGEPLIKKNIVSLCREIAAVPGIEELCLTTNGIRLPELAAPLREAGVRRINLSLDTLSPEKYRYMTRCGTFEAAWAGLEAALAAGFDRVKINAVLIGGFNDNEIRDLAELTLDRDLDVRFIELMPMEGSAFGPEAFVPASAVLEALPEARPETVPEDGVARHWRLPGARGRIGLILPLSNHFCAACNRIRITADGHVKPCLHRPGEYSLKGLSRSEMEQTLRSAILAKPAWHGELSPEHPSEANRSMNQIGG